MPIGVLSPSSESALDRPAPAIVGFGNRLRSVAAVLNMASEEGHGTEGTIMHILKVHTSPTDQPDTFDVHWTNTLRQPRGVIRVKVAAGIGDRFIAAELSALKHLLEHKEVLGNSVVGSQTTQLVVSCGAIRKLQRGQSNKAHLAPYSNFLTTRFADCRFSVDKDTGWFESIQPATVEHLHVTGPQRETLTLTGIGTVAVTQHVLERFLARFLPDAEHANVMREAWNKLCQLAGDPSVREVFREGLWVGVNTIKRGKQEGRYFLNKQHRLILVVAADGHGQQQLVTVYRSTRQFSEQPKAA